MSSQQTESDRIEHLTETVKKQLDLSVRISEELQELKYRADEMSTVKQEIDFVKFDRMILHAMVDRITLLEAYTQNLQSQIIQMKEGKGENS